MVCCQSGCGTLFYFLFELLSFTGTLLCFFSYSVLVIFVSLFPDPDLASCAITLKSIVQQDIFSFHTLVEEICFRNCQASSPTRLFV